MTDTELEALFAEKVLGWSGVSICHDGTVVGIRPCEDWEVELAPPLADLRCAFAGLAAHPEWYIEIGGDGKRGFYIWTADGKAECDGYSSLARAIVLACLRAVKAID